MARLTTQEAAKVAEASQGNGATIVQTILHRGYKIVPNSRRFSDINFSPPPRVTLVEGDSRW